MKRSLPEVAKEETRKLHKYRRTSYVLEKSSVLLMDRLRQFQAKLHFLVNVRDNIECERKKVHKIVL